MRGIYRFYEEGKLIAQAENLLTTNGKTAILRYLAGYSGHFGRSIRLGISPTAAAAGDTALGFEGISTPVYLITPDYTNTALIFKGRVDDALSMVIYEAGISSMVQDPLATNGSRLLLSFDQTTELWSGGTWGVSGRLGADTLKLSPAANGTSTATLVDMGFDLSDYSNADEFKIAYTPGSNVASAFIRFHTDASNYFTYAITPVTAGFRVATFNKGSVTTTGTPSWANITQITVSTTATSGGAASLDFEGLRVDDKDTYAESDVLISHAILGSPVTKTAGVPLDVEYTLDLTL